MGSVALTLIYDSFSEVGRLTGCKTLESEFPAWRRELLQLSIDKIFHEFLKFSEMVLDLKCIYLIFI